MAMPAARVLQLLDVLTGAGVPVWLDGGWGVDALLGRQHREHSDADLVVRLADLDRLQEALDPHGFSVAEDHLPTRLVLRTEDGEQLDLHPVSFDEHGDGWQAGAAADGTDCRYPADQFATGMVDGCSVPCLGPLVQVQHHSGYPPRAHDVQDMLRLTARYGLLMPPGYPSGADPVSRPSGRRPGTATEPSATGRP